MLPWLLSARSEAALRAQARRLSAHLVAHPELAPVDVAYTLAKARARFAHRAVLVGGGREALVEALDTLLAGRAGRGCASRPRAHG